MIKRHNRRMTALSMAIGIALLAGCNTKATTQTTSSKEGSTEIQLLSTTVEGQTSNIEVAYQAEDYYTDWNIEEVTKITLNGSEISAEGTGAEVEGSTVTITSGGTYVIGGKLNDGQIVVDSQDKEVVRLILNGAEITSSNSSPIYVKKAKKAVVSLEAGTTNKLSDSTNYKEVVRLILNGAEITSSNSSPIYVKKAKKAVVSLEAGTTNKLSDSTNYVLEEGLILNGAEITSSNSSPIYVKKAKKAVVSLEAGTTNKLSDSTNYVLEEGMDEPDAALFSKDDLTINGTGSLIIEANYNQAIASKDELKIMEGTIEVTSVGSGIKGKDMVAIKGGNITIKATKDGIKSTNATDSSKGFVYIEDGNFNIVAGNDGIQAETDIKVLGIKATKDGIKSTNATDSSKGFVYIEDGNFNIVAGNDGIQAETDIKVLGGSFNLNTGGGSSNGEIHVEELGGKGAEGMIRPENEGMTPPMKQGTAKPENEEVTSSVVQSNETSDNSEGATGETSDSFKGIKASGRISIDGGNFKIDSADDSIHSNTEIMINGGEFTILSGDDAIHADAVLVINGGNIHIDKSYEGLEANEITIAGGKTYVVASDDGVNAADGNSTETMGRSPVNSSSTSKLTISGGYLNIEANGDGMDANGSIYMTGGTVIVNGTVSGGNGALDYDNQFEISGGILVATGSSHMLQSPSSTSTQKSIVMTFTDYQEANSTVVLLDEEEELILSFMPSKKYQSIIISSSLLEEGKTYSLSYGGSVSGTAVDGLYEVGDYSGGTKVTDFTISDSTTYLSESGVTTGGNGMGQGRGMRPNDGQGGKRNREVTLSDTQIDVTI